MVVIKKLDKNSLSNKDLIKMLEIEKQYFLDIDGQDRNDAFDSVYVYSKADILEMFDECVFVIGAYLDENLVGYIAISKGNYDVGGKSDYYIYNFMVDVGHRGEKIGTILLVSAILDYLKKREEEFDFVTLDVEKGTKAQRLYEKIGFERYFPKQKLTRRISNMVSLTKFKIQGKVFDEDEIAMIISKEKLFDWAKVASDSIKYLNDGKTYCMEK